MRKLIKTFRYFRARARPKSALPFFWHVGSPNFGDDVNPAFFEKLSGKQIRYEKKRNRLHFLGMGSILGHANSQSTILGSGFIEPPSSKFNLPHKVVSVRGRLTQSYFQDMQNIYLGDPMVLVDSFISPEKSSDEIIGFVPHVSEAKKCASMDLHGLKIIDPSLSPMRVIHEIGTCSRIFSQSLHGLIVADAFKIPNIWVAPSPNMKGNDFKFKDYFSTMDSEKCPQPFEIEKMKNTAKNEFFVSEYLFDKREYREIIVEAMSKNKI
tara:strand:- start:533 stop:1333 length:801 start_codon:yes stop_codon:yes gene_type:complete